MDAAGKDGTIKHVMSGVNPQGCQVFSFKKPSAEELDHNFLWRYMRCLPERGRIGIFKRLYYEDVLVVKVHPELLTDQKLPPGKQGKAFWEAHYEDINAFERHLVRNGTIVLKFFLNVSKKEQTGRVGMQADEFQALVKALHQNGIEVILDVVFNHTAEGNEQGPTISFRGLDNRTYYMLTPGGHYYNFSGCGNTLNCNHPVVRDFVLSCLRHWVAEYHVDGFRFDLASILGRDQAGAPLPNPPLLEALAADAVLGKTKLIAEAWDAGGLYQVGS